MGKDYEVGYGKPPKKCQFKKGQSGNPKGRPKGAKNLETIIREGAYAKVTVKENGKTHKLTKVEVTWRRLLNKAIAGDIRAAKTVFELLREHLPQTDPLDSDNKPLSKEQMRILTHHADFLAVVEGKGDKGDTDDIDNP